MFWENSSVAMAVAVAVGPGSVEKFPLYFMLGFVEARDDKSSKCFLKTDTTLSQKLPNKSTHKGTQIN